MGEILWLEKIEPTIEARVFRAYWRCPWTGCLVVRFIALGAEQN